MRQVWRVRLACCAGEQKRYRILFWRFNTQKMSYQHYSEPRKVNAPDRCIASIHVAVG